jgi:DNA-binding response OmpR family regulator
MARQETHLLLLSDDESIRDLFCDALSRENAVCEGVATPEEALQRLMNREYAFLVLDLTSRSARPREVVEFLRRNPGVQRPLIFAIAQEATSLPPELDPRIVTMLVAKPFEVADVAAIIKQTLISLTSVASEDTLRKLNEARLATGQPPVEGEREGREGEGTLNRSVLVVDDDRTVQGLIVAALQREMLEPETAGDGAQAIARLKKKRFGAIILDLMMPRMSGWEVIDWLRENRDLTPNSVLISTAADRAVLHELDPTIVNAIFVKPFNALELAAYVHACTSLPVRDRRSKRVIGTQHEIRRTPKKQKDST